MNESITAKQLAAILVEKGILQPADLQFLKEDIEIPISIFTGKQTPQGALVAYLATTHKKTIKEISELLHTNLSATYQTYERAQTEELIIADSLTIPLAEFKKHTELSISEVIVIFLKNNGHKNIEIGKILGKDPRTIWTLEQRAKQKVKS